MALQTRKPTGEVGWPMVIVEGREGTRKTSEALRLSADPRIGASYVIEVGERRVDEYATLGTFDVVEHDESLSGIVRSIYDVMALPPHEGRPNLLVLDSGTAMWDLVKRAAEKVARSTKESQRKLADDPDANIDIGHHAWNAAKDPGWWDWLNDLRRWPGVFVMTVRADEVSKFVDGRPVANQTEYRLDVEKGTPFVVDAIVRMRGPRGALVTMAKSLKFSVPDDGIELGTEHPLAALVFDYFQAGTNIKLSKLDAQRTLLSQAKALGHDEDSAKVAARAAWDLANGGLDEFDHVAMSELIAVLELPSADPGPERGPLDDEPDEQPKVDEQPVHVPEVAPDPANGAGSGAQRPAEGLGDAERSDGAANAPEPAEGYTEEQDREAFDNAESAVVDAAVALVRRMDTPDVDAKLSEKGMKLTGNVQSRRARLAARLVAEHVRANA